MTDASHNPDDYCYRHPDRQSFVLCERCGRTICLECQTHVGGKVLCPDDAKNYNVTMMPVNQRPPRPKRVRRQSRLMSRVSETTPIVSYVLMGIIALLWLVDIIVGAGRIEAYLWMYSGQLAAVGNTGGHGALLGPWTLITSMVSSPAGGDGFLSVVFSLFSIFVIGRILEPQVGRARFLAIYLLSGFGAAVFALVFVGIVTSASGAIFGLVAAFVVIMRKRGVNMIFLYAVIALNIIAIALSSSRAVIWQGAVGGLLVGVSVGFTILFEGTPQKERQQRLLLIGIGALLLVAAVVRSIT
jgi:membrane associated rhomboid family serine protease